MRKLYILFAFSCFVYLLEPRNEKRAKEELDPMDPSAYSDAPRLVAVLSACYHKVASSVSFVKTAYLFSCFILIVK